MQNITIRVAQTQDVEQLDELMFRLHDEHHHQCPEHFKTAQEVEQEKKALVDILTRQIVWFWLLATMIASLALLQGIFVS